MKNLLYIPFLLLLIYGCNQAVPSVKVEDSVRYAAPLPGKMDENQFKHYRKILGSFFDSMLLHRGFYGGVLIAKEGQIIYEKYSGYTDNAKNDSITDSTSLHIASTSKTFTGVAVLQLVQQNKISLNDSIQRFFPGLPYPGVTVKMLLSHRSGIPNYLYFINNKNWDKDKTVTNNDVLQLLYTAQPHKDFNPGKRFSYCNTNFVLLALIVEKISGVPFPVYLQQNIFDPLQMSHTYVCTVQEMNCAARSFNYSGRIWDNDNMEGTYGDKNVYSTPRDLLKWDQALYTEQLVSKALLDSAFIPYSNERPSVHNYGLGFRMLLLKNGKKVIYHFGRWHGFNAAFARLTDEKATIIILGNKYNSNIYRAARFAYDYFGNYLQHGQRTDEEDNEPSQKAG